ncbi:5-formyltetrahydrofolate cyclo-ligase [Marinicrinis sediminis]|uniref:5-formyltetrahydrofolate cyclo-ligase n=1 Tax=Marinicrinis sediminis TaxID=1652465 RepID=A0ABW5R7S9_9BACL
MTMGVARQKQQLREKWRQWRETLSPQEHAIKSERVCSRLIDVLDGLRTSSTADTPGDHSPFSVFTFVPYGSEVNIRPVLEWMWGKGIQVICPICMSDNRMTLHAVSGWHALRPGKWGILEPDRSSPGPLLSHELDMQAVIFPGLLFDLDGRRLGYGKGYYDRWWAQAVQTIQARQADDSRSLTEEGEPLKIGVAFREQLLDHIPRDTHDVVMDLVVTDENSQYC